MPAFDLQAFLHQFVYDKKDPLLFNSGFFVYFFAVFISLYYMLRRHGRARAVLLSVFSLYFFYKASGQFVVLVLLSAVVDYVVSNGIFYLQRETLVNGVMARRERSAGMKLLLAFSVVFNLGMLFYFKYTDFFIALSNQLFDGHFHLLGLLLPIGISFYTFENLSYTIDVYKGEFVPERNFVNYLLFLSFFPKLVMGPIVRAKDFIPQLHKPYEVSSHDFAKGFYLIISGLFKKLVISDFITTNFVNYVFDGPSLHTGLECLLAVYGYAIVIYCDFSGFSDVAIGIAKWLGITIPPNFLSPYQSKSITEFWRRWHISLSSWLKDYLYIFSFGGNRRISAGSWIIGLIFFGGAAGAGIYAGLHYALWWPLIALGALVCFLVLPALFAKNKTSTAATSVNQMNTMLLGGFWHGHGIATWNFILWGAMHGTALAFHKLWLQVTGSGLARVDNRWWYKAIMLLITFHFVCFCWIFFKAPTFEAAGQMIHQIGHDFSFSVWKPLYENYRMVIWMMVLGYVLHALPDSMPDKIAARLARLPMPVYIIIFAAFMLVYAQFKGEAVMPIYLQF